MNITVQASELPGTLRVVPLLHLAGALSAPAHAQSGSVVLIKNESPHGTILVSDNTLYTLKASVLACGPACLKIWPAVWLPADVSSATTGTRPRAVCAAESHQATKG